MSDPVLGHFSIKEIMQLRPIPIWFLVHRILSKTIGESKDFFFLRTKIIEAKGFCWSKCKQITAKRFSRGQKISVRAQCKNKTPIFYIDFGFLF